MKITVERASAHETQDLKSSLKSPSQINLYHKPILQRKPSRRRFRTPGVGVLLKREVGTDLSAKRSGRPETPFLRWKFDEENDNSKEKSDLKSGRRVRSAASARKLTAGLWRLHLPEFQVDSGQRSGLQFGGGRIGAPKHDYHVVRRAPGKDLVLSPYSAAVPDKFESLFRSPNVAMEDVTKWDPVGWKRSDESGRIFSKSKHLDRRERAAPVISALEIELEKARARISELETDHRSSKKKYEHFLQKLSEERVEWRKREHEKVRAIIDDTKVELSREKKNRQRLEMVNSKMVNQLSDAKLLAKRYMQECEKERKDRKMIEEVCDELVKEIGDDRDEAEEVKRESIKLQHEVEEERKMLQMAEVWREERVQMKLVDAKVMLEEKYSQMNKLVINLQAFLNSTTSVIADTEEMKKAEFLWQAATSVNIQDIRELTYDPPNSDDIISIFEDANFGESNERETEHGVGYSPDSHTSKIHRVSPEAKMVNEDRVHMHSNVFMGESGELEEDTSEWETVSHAEDQDSSYSPDGSDPSVSRNYRTSNVSRNGDEMPVMEIGEVGSIPARKVSSISRLWRSYPSISDNFKILSAEGMKGRLTNEAAVGGVSPRDMAGQCSSPDGGNPQLTRGMKGCIEWPLGAQKSSLKARLLEARMGSQKIQLRQVLKQKI